jgi:hypothetical protein
MKYKSYTKITSIMSVFSVMFNLPIKDHHVAFTPLIPSSAQIPHKNLFIMNLRLVPA